MRVAWVPGVTGVTIASLNAAGYHCIYQDWRSYPEPPTGLNINLHTHFSSDFFSNKQTNPHLGIKSFHKARIVALAYVLVKDDAVVTPLWLDTQNKHIEGNHRWAALEYIGYDWLPITATPNQIDFDILTGVRIDDMIIKQNRIKDVRHGLV